MLENSLAKKLTDFKPETLEPFLSELKAILRNKEAIILAYGSCLSEKTRSATSTPDFYVVVPSYKSFYASCKHRWLNRILPPNIYHFSAQGQTAKYNVIRRKRFENETSARAKDCYTLGRMSKRIALASPLDSTSWVIDCQLSAMREVANKTFYLLPKQFLLEDFAKLALKLSYLADVRVEADDKIDKLYLAEQAFYDESYREILSSWPSNKIEFKESVFYRKMNPLIFLFGKVRTHWFLLKSRVRSQLRWPKGIFTVSNWIDYILAKIERTKGIKIQLTPTERKFWYIFAWKYFFRLRSHIK